MCRDCIATEGSAGAAGGGGVGCGCDTGTDACGVGAAGCCCCCCCCCWMFVWYAAICSLASLILVNSFSSCRNMPRGAGSAPSGRTEGGHATDLHCEAVGHGLHVPRGGRGHDGSGHPRNHLPTGRLRDGDGEGGKRTCMASVTSSGRYAGSVPRRSVLPGGGVGSGRLFLAMSEGSATGAEDVTSGTMGTGAAATLGRIA
jgi:hypothetical protein